MKIYSKFIFLLALTLLGCGHQEQEESEETRFIVTSPIKKDTTIFHDYVCQIHSIQHIELRVLEKGYLQNIYIDEGQLVKKGQLLFQIYPVIYRAEMQKAEAELNFARIEYLNTKLLADSQVVSKNELALSKAHLDKAEAELSLSKAHYNFTEIRAPFDGVVGRFNDVRLGSLVDEGELLTTLSDNRKMWVYYNVPETEYLDFATAPKKDSMMHVKLQLANGKLFEEDGIVETIEADFNNETGNIAFRATFNNSNSILRNGETGNILMPVILTEAILIPQQSTFEILDKKYVFVIDNNEVKTREIKVGAEIPHLYEVKEGLSENDKILVEGLRKVKNGQKIEYDFEPLNQLMTKINHLHAE